MPKPNTSLSSLLRFWSTPATPAAAAKKIANRFVHSCVARGIDEGRETNINAENYLHAICNRDNKYHLDPLLDVKQILSLDRIDRILQSFGRLSLESRAESLLLALKEYDVKPEDISGLIFSYATSIPNLTVEDVLLRFKNLHTGIEMTPSSRSYTNLVKHCCGLSEVHVAFVVVDQMCKAGLSLSMDIIHTLMNAIEESSDFYLVQRIYSLICHYDLKPNMKTFRQLISLSVKMNDFDGAYGMLNDLKQLKLAPTAIVYNDIIGGYFREKRFSDVSKVVNQMKLAHVKLAHVKPDCSTYAYLINSCESEEKVTEVLLYKGFPIKYREEIKSMLVSALASHGEMADALDIYDEIKEGGLNLAPRAAVCLIEHLQHKGELSRVLQLVEELHDPLYFADGCYSAIRYCIHNKHLRHTVDLLKRLKDRFCDDDLAMEGLFDEVFSLVLDTEPLDLQIGLDLLQAIKNELAVTPSRKCLDLLFGACTKAKDLHNSLSVWKEYQAAGFPYNVTNYIWMYSTLLDSQAFANAEIMLKNIPRDDPQVCMVIEALQEKYIRSNSVKH